jgi:hypothetical protein
MIEIDNFLVIFSLEVGGKFIGLFALVTHVIVLTVAFLLLVAVSIDKDFTYLRQKLDEFEIEVSRLNLPDDEKAVKHLREYVIMMLVLLIIISGIYIISGYLLVRGTRNVKKVKFQRTCIIFNLPFLAKSPSSQAREEPSRFSCSFLNLCLIHETFSLFNDFLNHLHLPLCRDKFSLEKVHKRTSKRTQTNQRTCSEQCHSRFT